MLNGSSDILDHTSKKVTNNQTKSKKKNKNIIRIRVFLL